VRSSPGKDFWYGNIGLNIAGRVIEIISKKKFEEVIKEKLFDPLGMSNTSFAAGKGGAVNPSGGASSTADDYMKFLQMMLNYGNYRGKKILSGEAVEQMKEVQNKARQIQYAPKAAEGYTYALGSWVMESSAKDTIVVTHEGKDKPNPMYIPIVKATSLASPGLFGTWPMVDYCRGYAYIVFVKNLLGGQRAEVHKELKKNIDKEISTSCR
jgi:CubicO group peptidase (beta-lactamase class C family)